MRHFFPIATAMLLAVYPTQGIGKSPAENSADKIIAKINSLNWIHGPARVAIGNQAVVDVPKGSRYLDAVSTRQFLTLNGNPPQDSSYTVAPEALTWFSILEFDPAGYVPDRDNVNPSGLFKQLKEGELSSNNRRHSLGLNNLYLDRWLVEPHYDQSTHNLEWGTQMHGDDGSQTVNYTSRILGREGVTRAILVTDPKNFSADRAEYQQVMSHFSYVPQKSYEAHQSGDKIAAYGLGALVAGGAAAAVVKTGAAAGGLALLAKVGAVFFKGIALVAVGLVVAVGSWLKRLFGRNRNT